jgi:hypothetical protein
MSIKVTLTEEEILGTPNDMELGEKTRNKYWQARRDHEGPQYDDEHVVLNIGEDGLVKSIGNPWVCSYCKQSTKDVDYDYLVGYDHLGCVLDDENNLDVEEDNNKLEFDKCVLCGKESPYFLSTHIDLRQGYVEGGGQGCFQPNVCGKN